jgi:hypothetical protein
LIGSVWPFVKKLPTGVISSEVVDEAERVAVRRRWPTAGARLPGGEALEEAVT